MGVNRVVMIMIVVMMMVVMCVIVVMIMMVVVVIGHLQSAHPGAEMCAERAIGHIGTGG